MTQQKTPLAAIILVHESSLQSWVRDASTFVLFGSLIGLGILTGSSALQWVGAIIGFITIGIRSSGRTHRMTIAEARQKLDEIEGRDHG